MFEKVTKTLDLHNLSLQEALCKAESEINKGVVEKYHRLDLIHGHGTGILRGELHLLLEEYSNVIDRFELDWLNPGVTKVYF